MSELLVSIDLGTTRLKVAAFSLDGTLQQLVVRRHKDHHQGDRSWQDAEGWWQDTVSAIKEMLTALSGRTVLGISLAGRGGAAVFADGAGNVVVDPWSDARHAKQAQLLRGWRSGGVDLPNYGLQLIAKYQWLQEQHPAATENIEHGYYAKDWLLACLTGVHKTDWTSGPDGPAWDRRLDELKLPCELLPEPALPWEIAGELTADAAAALGLPAGMPVAVGAHDGLSANIGAGAIEPGQYAITLGTHAVVRAIQAEHPPGAYRFYGFPPDMHVIGGNALLAGRSADWFLDLLEVDDEFRNYQEMEQAAAAVAAGADGVRFLPFLAGQVAPELRAGARAVFAGLSLGHGRAELYRAVLEGASFAVRGIFDQVVGWCGAPSLLRATGGGAESELWMTILASVLDRPVEIPGTAVEARGAAMCLAVALGVYQDLAEATGAMVRVQSVIEPDPGLARSYRSVFSDWSSLNELSRNFDSH